MRFVRSLTRIVRFCLSKILDRQFLIFLSFLILSAAFWLFQALDEEYEVAVRTELELTNVPKNVVITTPPPQSVQVTLRDKGYTLLRYLYGRELPSLTINFTNVANKSGHVRLAASSVYRQLTSRLTLSTRVVACRPDTVEFFFNYGLSKRVPVRLVGHFRPAKEYHISAVRVNPDSVTVYAAGSLLDTISVAYLQPVRYGGFTDTIRFDLKVQPQLGAKFVPDHASIELDVDRLTEKTVEVPVRWINFPATKTLRAFPSKVNVTFQVGLSNYRHVSADDFTLVVNYEDLLKDNTGRYTLNLRSIPPGVSHVRISPQTIDYLIEDVPTE